VLYAYEFDTKREDLGGEIGEIYGGNVHPSQKKSPNIDRLNRTGKEIK
jgi:hypothetical protein